MITGYIASLGSKNPRTYGPTYERLPDVTLPIVANVGASGSTALATQNTGIVSAGGGTGAGSMALLPQMNAQAANYALAIPDLGNVAINPVGEGGRGSIDNSTRMFRKVRDVSYVEPMPKKQLRRIVKAFKRQGGIIQMDDATDAYLKLRNAEGIALNENTILLRQKPGRASVFEELIHATQFRQGLNDGSQISRIQNEIAAQEMLLRNSKAYNLTSAEIKQTQSALASYLAELSALMGGK